ncbi:MAG TPA: arylsulfotransferase family protein [Jatrophihabitans sp.]|jgi:hypothetical protein
MTGTDAGAASAQRAVTVTTVAPNASNYPAMTVTERIGKPAPGYIFAGPKIDGPRPSGAPVGPMILDGRGRPVYFMNTQAADRATDVRVQTYHGKRVMTYWLGGTGANPGIGVGDDYIVDQHYKVLRVVHWHGTDKADQHEFNLEPDGVHALIVSYHQTTTDATRAGGPANQAVFDGVVQEVNLKTSKVDFEWHSLNHVGVANSYEALPANNTTPWDYFHINAVKVDTDGNFIISSRHTWTVYKVNRTTKKIMWSLGGKKSTFTIGRGAAFSWQHDPEPLGNNTYRIFDNAATTDAGVPPTHPQSRVITIQLNLKNKTATNLGHIVYPTNNLSAPSQGNAQTLPAGHTFVDWGQQDHITEFNAHRQMIFDAQFPTSPTLYDSYRAYKSAWVGTPTWSPTAKTSTPNGKRQIDALWNGASTVNRWRILGGASRTSLHIIGRVNWNGYDTAFRLSSYPKFVQLVAIDSHGNALKRTAPLQVS